MSDYPTEWADDLDREQVSREQDRQAAVVQAMTRVGHIG